MGDFESLDRTGRRALHVHLPRAIRGLLTSCLQRLLDTQLAWADL